MYASNYSVISLKLAFALPQKIQLIDMQIVICKIGNLDIVGVSCNLLASNKRASCWGWQCRRNVIRRRRNPTELKTQRIMVKTVFAFVLA